MNTNLFQVVAFYKFYGLSNLDNLQNSFHHFLSKQKIKGTVLLASEGINGTVAGSSSSIEEFKKFLAKENLLPTTDFKISFSKKEPFLKLKVKIKNEIVSIGNDLANPTKIVGEYIQPEDWNNVIYQDNVLVIDKRNINDN